MAAEIDLMDRGAVEHVIEAAKGLLETVGVRLEHPETVDLLGSHGARVDHGKGRVFIAAELVERCLETAPKKLTLFDRDRRPVAFLGTGRSHFAPGSAALYILDPGADDHRRATRDDLDRLARLSDRLPAFPLQATGLVPGDVPERVADRVRLYHALRECRKPIITGVFEEDGLAPMLEMLEAVRGSAAELERYPLAVFDCCSIAPLMWPAVACSTLVRCARRGVPAELISVPLCGATGPVTLHGALVQIAAENLSGVVIHQSARPGAPLIWGGCPMAFDMRKGTTPTGAPETMLLNAASARVARHLGLPSHGYLGLSDSKRLDLQAGSETSMGATMAALSGIEVVSGAGMLSFIGCLSLEKLAFDAEICAAAIRLQRGVEPQPTDGLCDLFERAIGGKGFLSMKHTRENFRREMLFPGDLVDRNADSRGNEGLEDRCRAAVEELTREPTEPLAREVEGFLDEILESEMDRCD